jgi:hypothetical protein
MSDMGHVNNGQLRQGAARYLMVLAQKIVRRDMLVRIIKTPGGIIDGFDVRSFKIGSVYDLPTSLASVLILDGYGFSEMRGTTTQVSTDRGKRERSSDKPRNGSKPEV